MKRQRRDRSEQLFSRGFQAGVGGRSFEFCPYQDVNLKQHWMAGWREGRACYHQGMSGVSALPRMSM